MRKPGTWLFGTFAGSLLFAAWAMTTVAVGDPALWQSKWPRTDFTRNSVEFSSIRSGGPPKDGIPPIDEPRHLPVAEITEISGTEPVIGVIINGQARAYPLYILMWHEIVNDTLGGVPIAVTYCPLCNTAIVFERELDGRLYDFGTTGKLRYSDLVMYDRQTESWWQQFLGEAIVGELTGAKLKIVPSRLESFAKFAARAPNGTVLVPTNPNLRRYGINPYVGYDTSAIPFLYRGETPDGIFPLARVVSLGPRGAWSLALVRERKRIELDDGVVITWEAGQNSALDTSRIAEGRDVGNVVVQRMTEDGPVDVVYGVEFAFAYHAFHPDSPIYLE